MTQLTIRETELVIARIAVRLMCDMIESCREDWEDSSVETAHKLLAKLTERCEEMLRARRARNAENFD